MLEYFLVQCSGEHCDPFSFCPCDIMGGSNEKINTVDKIGYIKGTCIPSTIH